MFIFESIDNFQSTLFMPLDSETEVFEYHERFVRRITLAEKVSRNNVSKKRAMARQHAPARFPNGTRIKKKIKGGCSTEYKIEGNVCKPIQNWQILFNKNGEIISEKQLNMLKIEKVLRNHKDFSESELESIIEKDRAKYEALKIAAIESGEEIPSIENTFEVKRTRRKTREKFAPSTRKSPGKPLNNYETRFETLGKKHILRLLWKAFASCKLDTKTGLPIVSKDASPKVYSFACYIMRDSQIHRNAMIHKLKGRIPNHVKWRENVPANDSLNSNVFAKYGADYGVGVEMDSPDMTIAEMDSEEEKAEIRESKRGAVENTIIVEYINDGKRLGDFKRISRVKPPTPARNSHKMTRRESHIKLTTMRFGIKSAQK